MILLTWRTRSHGCPKTCKFRSRSGRSAYFYAPFRAGAAREIFNIILRQLSLEIQMVCSFTYVHGGPCGPCGPSCEAWSQARYVKIADELGRQPRPLRSIEDLWEVPSLALKELSQVAVGDELLIFSLVLLICLACSDGCAVLKHPAPPSDLLKPSIWRLPIVQILGQLPGFEQFDFAQGLLGAKSPKPTRFLTPNLSNLPRLIHSHSICPDLPKSTAIGKETTGHWATASLKEYPPALNRALGEAFANQLLHRSTNDDIVIDEVFMERCWCMHASHFGHRIGPDYKGHRP